MASTALTGLQVLADPSFMDRNPGVAAARMQEKLRAEVRRNLELAASDPRHFGTGATNADLGDLNDDLAANPYSDEGAAGRMKFETGLDQAKDPRVQELEAADLSRKLQLAEAPAKAQAAGAVQVEQEKNRGTKEIFDAQQAGKDKLYQALGITGGGGGGAHGAAATGAPGSFKPAVNAAGDVSFTQNTMPALVQRARNQLMDARDKTLTALQEAERMYPGINDAGTSADSAKPQGWLSTLTGLGAQKYGSAMDLAGAANDRLKYTVGIPTPFANLAQSASFGNIEQMAGQLPGVRGLATISPLFKEHQSRWGKETPLATVQRLRHMASIMDQTLSTIESGGADEVGQ